MRKIFSLILILIIASAVFAQSQRQFGSDSDKDYLFCYVCDNNRMIKSYFEDSRAQRRVIEARYNCRIITIVPYCGD
jgi:hypothetical protein